MFSKHNYEAKVIRKYTDLVVVCYVDFPCGHVVYFDCQTFPYSIDMDNYTYLQQKHKYYCDTLKKINNKFMKNVLKM